MRALVTGATGFIGSHLVPKLLKDGYKVRCLTRKASSLEKVSGLPVELYTGDLSDPGSLVEAVRGVDYIFHLAGLTKTNEDREFYDVNARGTRNLVETAARENPGLKKFIYLSSLAAAGPVLEDLTPLTEEVLPHPVSHYGKSKLLGEKAVSEAAGKFPVIIMRPTAVYGPGDRDFYLLFKMIKKGIFLYWGMSHYSLIYVEDLVRAIAAAATAGMECGKEKSKIYFLSDGNIYSNLEIAAAIAQAMPWAKREKPVRIPVPRFLLPVAAAFSGIGGRDSGIINRDKLREMRFKNWCCSAERARSEIGFEPLITLKEGVKWTADWYRSHQWI
ncbi:MAG: NAD-dependent epimerase/dehydratase family protein [Nitrospiraceae bacterium]|nr:NAD-dependent epimerase/dehydratase family protein [Nitrospiraceae bacterium]